MKQANTITLLLAVLAFGIVIGSQKGWPANFIVLVSLDALITVLYLLVCWYNRRFIKQLASKSSEEQQAIIGKMPPVVQTALNRELNS